jgi:uncharacterized protein (DUF924 family)
MPFLPYWTVGAPAWELLDLPERHRGPTSLPRAGDAGEEGERGARSKFDAADAAAVVDFWRSAGPAQWFAKDPVFDREFREQFLAQHEAAARGALENWLVAPYPALALVLLLDQFPRNAFRGTPRMYATDAHGRSAADAAIRAGCDHGVETTLRLFFYLPFAHSEDLNDQEHSVALARRLGQPHLAHAEGHRDIVRRFGRFPHRNPILGRTMTAEEQRFLDEGGFAG